MVVLAKGELEQIALPAAQPPAADVRSVDLSAAAGPVREAAARALVAACEEHGFFRVTGHGVPAELVRAAEAAASVAARGRVPVVAGWRWSWPHTVCRCCP